MNEKVDLTKILKNCPKGFKLYSTVCGEVEFDKIKEDRDFPIVCVTTGGSYGYVTADGRYCLDFDEECTLFPSKDQRDWSKFTAPWYKQDKDDERLRKTTIAFLKDFAEQGYENAVECIDWLEKQDEDKKEINNFDVLPGLYKCIHRMFNGTPDGRLLFEIDNVYKCLSKHDRAEFEVSYGHSVYLEDPIVRKYFIPFEDEQIPSPKFKVGDWLCANELNNYANLIKIIEIVDVFGKKRYKISRDYDSDLDLTEFDFIEKHYHLWNIQDAKVGDVLADEDNNIGIFQECEGMYWYSYTYLGCDGQLRGFSMGGSHEQTDTHPATKEQRDLLFRKIKEAGYKWNAETKTLEKLVEPKFDQKTLQSFDKVLVRDTHSKPWRCSLFSHIETERHLFPYATCGGNYSFCIPYNDDTKHLIGKADETPEYYRYWKD